MSGNVVEMVPRERTFLCESCRCTVTVFAPPDNEDRCLTCRFLEEHCDAEHRPAILAALGHVPREA